MRHRYNRFFLRKCRWWLAGAMLLMVGNAVAQPAVTDADALQYRVEMVVFTQPSLGNGAEEFPFERTDSLARPMAWPLRESDRPGLGYQRLDDDSYLLTRAARRLDAQPEFTVHWHAAWIQPGAGRFQAQAVALPRSLRDAGLAGWVRVYRERFLHAETDIRFEESGELVAQMSDSRRMRSDEQHYLDNPRIGVLVRVDRWEEDQRP